MEERGKVSRLIINKTEKRPKKYEAFNRKPECFLKSSSMIAKKVIGEMEKRRKVMLKVLILILAFAAFSSIAAGCSRESGNYTWSEISSKAAFPEGYNYPVFVFGNWMVAINKGAWL